MAKQKSNARVFDVAAGTGMCGQQVKSAYRNLNLKSNKNVDCKCIKKLAYRRQSWLLTIYWKYTLWCESWYR